LQLKQLYPLHFNTITGNGVILFKIIFQKQISFRFQKVSPPN